MYSFAGFMKINQYEPISPSKGHDFLQSMVTPLCHTSEEVAVFSVSDNFGVAQAARQNDAGPCSLSLGDRMCHIVLDGDIFNLPSLRKKLAPLQPSKDESPAGLLLLGFMEYGMEFIKEVNGNFALAIYDQRHHTLYLFRDHFGSKPLFYTQKDGIFAFSSEIKALLEFRDEIPTVSKEGLNEIFSIGPARTPGKGVFDHIFEVKPAHCISVNKYGTCSTGYWQLSCRPHYENYEETVLHTADLLDNIMKNQLALDDSPACLLSGGIDSSIIAAYLKQEMERRGQKTVTISFDFAQNDKYFKSSSFQPSQDKPYIDAMVKFLQSEHHYLECNYQTLADMLKDSVKAHDLPCMADIDSSLLYFSSKVAGLSPVAYTGECADEVFGGYPWMHRGELPIAESFPWAADLAPRKQLLKADFLEALEMDSYVETTYNASVKNVCVLPEEDESKTLKRRYSYLNLYWFMETLLNRMDRSCRVTGLTARIPFADKELVQYIYNVPWEMKARNGLVKSLLRQSAEPLLPQPILLRKKSPFPKTYHPYYERLLSGLLIDVLKDTESPLHQFIDSEKVTAFLNTPKDLGAPWYGQLMCGPQMIAYLLQINFWILEYKLKIQL